MKRKIFAFGIYYHEVYPFIEGKGKDEVSFVLIGNAR